MYLTSKSRRTRPSTEIVLPEPGRMNQRVIRSVRAHASGLLLVTAGNLLIVPIYLVHWSPTVYGEWLALFSFVMYLRTLDMGMHTAVANRLTQAFSRGDLEEYRRTQHSAMAFYLCLALSVSLLLGLATWTLPLRDWLGLEATGEEDGSWTMWLLGLLILWGMPISMVSVVYRSTGHLARDQWAANGFQALGLVTAALILVLGGEMRSVALGQLLSLLLITGYVVWDVGRRFPGFLPGLSHASLSVLKDLLRPSLLFGLILLAVALAQQGSVVIISSALGGAAVAVFVTSRTLANLIRQAVSALVNALWPELTRMEALGEWERLRSVHRLLTAGSTLLCVGFAAALWFKGTEVILAWTNGRLEPDVTLLRLLLVMLVLQSPWMVSLVFTAAANRHGLLARAQLLASVLGVTLAGLLILRLGVHAVPVGLTIGEAAVCYHFVIRDTCHMIGEPYGPYAKWLWFGLSGVVAGALLAAWVAQRVMPGPPLLACVGVSAVALLAAAGVTWLVWLTPADRSALRSHLPPILGFRGRERVIPGTSTPDAVTSI